MQTEESLLLTQQIVVFTLFPWTQVNNKTIHTKVQISQKRISTTEAILLHVFLFVRLFASSVLLSPKEMTEASASACLLLATALK